MEIAYFQRRLDAGQEGKRRAGRGHLRARAHWGKWRRFSRDWAWRKIQGRRWESMVGSFLAIVKADVILRLERSDGLELCCFAEVLAGGAVSLDDVLGEEVADGIAAGR